jgi:hypothetical protein
LSAWYEAFKYKVKNDPKKLCDYCNELYPGFMVVQKCCINCAIKIDGGKIRPKNET